MSLGDTKYLLEQWAIWSRTEGVIPRKLQAVSARWQREIPSDYPEEPDHNHCDADDETMGIVDRVVAELGRTQPKHYVVIVDVYRNHRSYAKSVEDDALKAFADEYRRLGAHHALDINLCASR